MGPVFAVISCALIGLNMIPIVAHSFTCSGLIADDLQVGQSTTLGIIS